MKKHRTLAALAFAACIFAASGCAKPEGSTRGTVLTDDQIENVVRRSYQYVAMYNVIQKNAAHYGELTGTSGWDICVADTELKDHSFKTIARPNNDTLYSGCLLDLRAEPIVVEYPVFDSKYVVLETSAYDHYCDIPLSTTKGDFQKPTRILFYTARTAGYSGEAVEGVDKIVEMSGDFVIAFLRVMPHAAQPERMQRNLAAMQTVTPLTLSAYRGESAAPTTPADFPAVGTDVEVFGGNFPQVMQFVLNHTTFDSGNELDQALLAALEPLGLAPGKDIAPDEAAAFDGARFGEIARQVQQTEFAQIRDPDSMKKYALDMFKPKEQMSLDVLLLQSVLGPIGLPSSEAIYPSVTTSDGTPMNARYDYVIRMSKEELPPARAFWSTTLYDSANGFFIPNDRKKYSVGENAGMKLDKSGGIAIYIAAEKPSGVPEENWLPINRQDEALDVILRIYAPDQERFATWTAPTAEKLMAASR